MTQITINDDVCWICGEKFTTEKGKTRTTHHVLPQHLRPKKNVLLPLHEDCHEKMNEHDFSGILSFAYSIMKSAQRLVAQTGKLTFRLKKIEQYHVEDAIKEQK